MRFLGYILKALKFCFKLILRAFNRFLYPLLFPRSLKDLRRIHQLKIILYIGILSELFYFLDGISLRLAIGGILLFQLYARKKKQTSRIIIYGIILLIITKNFYLGV